jgi:hypothetical protein
MESKYGGETEKAAMGIREGTKVKSSLTGEIYRVKAVRGMALVLEAEDGRCSIITELGNLNLFYETLEKEDRSKNPSPRKNSQLLTIARA